MRGADRKPTVRGHLLSSPIRWAELMEAMKQASLDRPFTALPHTGAILAARVQVQISSAATDAVRYLSQAKVRAEVVVELIRLLKDTGHPDFADVDMAAVTRKAKRELPTMAQHGPDGAVPPEIIRLDSEPTGKAGDAGLNPDKNATPTEPLAEGDVALKYLRPQVVASQRYSDTGRCPKASFAHAMEQHSVVALRTGSTALQQFQWDYLPRAFPFVYPFHIGAPDFARSPSRRVALHDLTPMGLALFARCMARRVEYQIRADFQYLGGIWN